MASLTEAFGYSNGSLPTVSSGAWTTAGLGDHSVASNRTTIGSTGTLYANFRALGFTPAGDWEANATLNAGTNTAASTGQALWLLNGSYNGYGFYVNGTSIGISEIAGGTPTTLISASVTVGTGDNTWRLRRTSAGVIKLWRNGDLVLQITDTSYSGPTQVLMLSQSNSATTYPSWDNLFFQDSITDIAPSAVVISSAIPSNTQVTLNWAAPDDGGDTITDYVVQYRDDVLWSTFSDGTSSTPGATVTGLTNDVEYEFRVAAVNGVGQGNWSATVALEAGEPAVGEWIDVSPFPSPDVASNFGWQSIAINSLDEVFVTVDYGGLYKSTDHGNSWTHHSTDGDLESGTPWTLQVDPSDDDVMWANAGYGVGGPLKSTDGGQTWTKMAAGSPTAADDVYCIAIDPSDPDHLLATWHTNWAGDSSSGVSETINGGTSWTNIPAPTDDWGTGHAIFFLGDSDTWLLACQNEGEGIWRTTNGGSSWTEVYVGGSMTHGATQCLTRIDASTYVLALNHGMAKSTDGGATWTDINTSLDTGLYYSSVPSDGTNLYTGGSFPIDGVYGTIDIVTRPIASGSWALDQDTNMTNGPRQWAIDSEGRLFTANYRGGVWRVLTQSTAVTSRAARRRRPALAFR